METTGSTAADKPGPLLFVVLVPHRDCLPGLEAYSRRLFAAGLDGAYSFPAAAPLALLTRPLSAGELKAAAAELRKLLGDKKIVSLKEGECSGWTCDRMPPVRFFGPVLELPLPAFPADAVVQRWKNPILAPAILSSGSYHGSSSKAVMDDGPRWSTGLCKQTGSTWCTQPSQKLAKVPLLMSRAAALANLALAPVPAAEAGTGGTGSFDTDHSFTWKLGPLYWLPRYTGGKSGCTVQSGQEDG